METLPGTLEAITARLQSLERRVEALEHPSTPLSATAVIPAPSTKEAAEELSFAHTGSLFSVLGKAMLGIAGAYLLRAVAESTAQPRLLGAIAILYALLWLVAAARVPAAAWIESTIYAGASALILAPMLWELTLSFKILSATATAAILAIFVLAATLLAWKHDRAPLFWVAYLIAACAALALSIASQQLVPFIATLLLMALLAEYAATRGHQRSVRPLVAAAADVAIWALIFIYSSPQSSRTQYPELTALWLLLPGCLLFLIYGVSVVYQTTFLARKITIFETGQAIIAFILAAVTILTFATRNGVLILGALCLLFSFACYETALRLFVNKSERRNFHVFAAWAAALLLAGSFLCLPPLWLAIFLGLAAMAATLLTSRLTLNAYGLLFLLAASVASGLLEFAFQALAGTHPASLPLSAAIVAACALVSSAASKHQPQESWKPQLLHLATAALAAFALAALLVRGMVSLVAMSTSTTPQAHSIAFLRTLILCAVALALAFAGARWRRVELTRIAYAALALVAVKLLFEDLRQGHLAFIAAAIFLFALTLIAVPRLAHKEWHSH